MEKSLYHLWWSAAPLAGRVPWWPAMGATAWSRPPDGAPHLPPAAKESGSGGDHVLWRAPPPEAKAKKAPSKRSKQRSLFTASDEIRN